MATQGFNSNVLDSLIYLTIVLFILSVIVEKITQLIRHYPWQTKWILIVLLVVFEFMLIITIANDHLWYLLYLLGNTLTLVLVVSNLPDVRRALKQKNLTWAQNLSVLQNINSKAEAPSKQKEQEITFLSFLVGLVIAYTFNANLIALFVNAKELTSLGWPPGTKLAVDWVLCDDVFLLNGYTYFGFALTGFFLTFGSKFFHDLLDTLLQVKELKRKMNDQQTFQPDNIKQFDQFLSTDYNELAKICLDQNQSTISALPGLASYFIGLSSNPINRKPVIVLHTSLPQNAGYPSSFQGKLDSGKLFTIDTEVIYNFDPPTIHLDAGDSVNHSNYANKPGTICCSVKNAQGKYLLTCAHVMTGGAATISVPNKNGWITTPTPNDSESEDLDFNPVGDWAFGVIDHEMDTALVLSEITVSPIMNLSTPPADYSTELNGEHVFVNGKLNKTSAYIRGFIDQDIEFQYNGSKHKLRNLILISKNKIGEPRSATQGGDSGALVFIAKSKIALGMVVGGNTQYSYVIPMTQILSKTQTQLI